MSDVDFFKYRTSHNGPILLRSGAATYVDFEWPRWLIDCRRFGLKICRCKTVMEAVVKPNDLSQPSAGFVSFTYSCRMSATTKTVARELGSGRRYFCWAFRMLQIHCLDEESNRKLQVPHAGGRVRVVDQLHLRYMPRARDTDEGVVVGATQGSVLKSTQPHKSSVLRVEAQLQRRCSRSIECQADCGG
eukprot:COSAG05_NODE_2581_length_2876_cov_7.356860_3_plen_189_part_00